MAPVTITDAPKHDLKRSSVSLDAKHPSDVIGNWGPVQRRIVLSLLCVYLVAPFNNHGIIFYLPKQDFYCNYFNETVGSYVALKNKCSVEENGSSYKCSNFTYDTSEYKRTLISEFDLVCDKSFYGSLAQTTHQLGYMISGPVVGLISDRYGRRFAAQLAMSLEVLAGFGQAFAPTMGWFFFSRFFVGISSYGRFLSGFVLVTEWVGPEMRAQATFLYEYGFMIGDLMLPLCFWLNPDYVHTQMSTSSFEICLLILLTVYVWESPRWLLTHGKHERASDYMLEAAKRRNKLEEKEIEYRIKRIIANTSKEIEEEKEKKVNKQTILDIWRVPALLKLCLMLYFVWMTCAFIGYSQSFNIGSLGGSMYISYSINTSSALITTTLQLWLIEKFPRKKFVMVTISISITGLTGMFFFSLSDTYYWPKMICYIVFNMGRSATWYVCYVYTAESFPTTLRHSCIGACSFFGRIGSSVAPFVKELTKATSFTFVIGIYLVMESINLVLFSLLPETGQIQLPDTIGQKKKEAEMRRMSTRSVTAL